MLINMEQIVIEKEFLDEMLKNLKINVDKPLNIENYHCSKYAISIIENIIENSKPLK